MQLGMNVKERFESWKKEWRWEYPSNYSGNDYSDCFFIYSQCRDSDLMVRTNWDTLTEEFKSEIEAEYVEVSRASHWAVGWVESILIKDNAPLKVLFKAFKYRECLNDYPIIDDSAYSENEWNEAYEYAESEASSVSQVLQQVFNIPNDIAEDKEFLGLCVLLNVEHQMAHGVEDAALFNNQYCADRMDDRDFEHFKDALESIECNLLLDDSQAYKYLSACFCLVA